MAVAYPQHLKEFSQSLTAVQYFHLTYCLGVKSDILRLLLSQSINYEINKFQLTKVLLSVICPYCLRLIKVNFLYALYVLSGKKEG